VGGGVVWCDGLRLFHRSIGIGSGRTTAAATIEEAEQQWQQQSRAVVGHV